mmetsp:Transcript_27381/g.42768  ORF Transcript_27381/g.42768 Transcript_27381/m.42768 type:complete len:228 (-) Transcript_27381:227-910(-)
MANLVIVQRRKDAARRQELVEQKKHHDKFVKEVMKQWGETGSQGLEFEQLRSWLTSINQGEPVSEDEAKWVMAMANQAYKDENGTTFKDLKRATVLPADFEKAVDAYLSYKDSAPEITEMFKKFDPDGNANLDRAELTEMLTELNEGVAPQESEVDWVMKEADIIGQGMISKPCLAKAISLWYTHVEEQANSPNRTPRTPRIELEEDVPERKEQVKSSACSSTCRIQ